MTQRILHNLNAVARIVISRQVKMEEEESVTAVSEIFIPPSVAEHNLDLLHGKTYSHFSPIPANITVAPSTFSTNANEPLVPTPCVLGIDEAGRGPVIGPMVYGVFYLPVDVHSSLLTQTYHFNDSKQLTPVVRTNLTKRLCTSGTDLDVNCGWAVTSLSAADISANMLRAGGSYNLNAQAMDATIELIRGVLERGVNVQEIYIDTIGQPAVYQRKLERIFPTTKITVAKKADSLFPCVSAASVVAKVTRDISCEVLLKEVEQMQVEDGELVEQGSGWASGYPSDAKCVAWLKRCLDPTFGWGNEVRYSWGGAVKDLLDEKGAPAVSVDWLDEKDDGDVKLSRYFGDEASLRPKTEAAELRQWYGLSVGADF